MHRTSRAAARAALAKVRELRLLAENLLEDVRLRGVDAESLVGLAGEYEAARRWALRNAREVYELMPSVEPGVIRVGWGAGADGAERLLWRIATGCRVAEEGLKEILYGTGGVEGLPKDLEVLDDEFREQSISVNEAGRRQLHVKALLNRVVKAFRGGRPVKRSGKSGVEKILEGLFVPYSYPG